MNEQKRRNVNRKALAVFSVLLLIALAAGVFLCIRRDVTYQLKEPIKAVFAPAFAPEKVSPEIEKQTLSQLHSDARVRFDQSMLLINTENRITNNLQAEIAAYKNTDVQMNQCISESYSLLSDAVLERFSEKLYICSAFRTEEEQKAEYSENSRVAAEIGASEHQVGLALDVYVKGYAGKALLKTEAGRYINDHCAEYGFIIRYPVYGEKETGIPYEPWHLRYVGQPHAQILSEHCLTLEAYYEKLEYGCFYQYGNYLISRQKGDAFDVPHTFLDAVISEDNMGGYVLTFRIA